MYFLKFKERSAAQEVLLVLVPCLRKCDVGWACEQQTRLS